MSAHQRMLDHIDRCVAHQREGEWYDATVAWVKDLYVESGDGRRPLLSLKEDA